MIGTVMGDPTTSSSVDIAQVRHSIDEAMNRDDASGLLGHMSPMGGGGHAEVAMEAWLKKMGGHVLKQLADSAICGRQGLREDPHRQSACFKTQLENDIASVPFSLGDKATLVVGGGCDTGMLDSLLPSSTPNTRGCHIGASYTLRW